jgi:hypothetical protein
VDPDETDSIFDLSNTSFDEFVRFWFDRSIDPRAMGPPRDPDFAWYANIEIRCEPRQYAESFIRLFNAPEFLLDRYSKDQLEEGFWAMVSPMVEGGIGAGVWSAAGKSSTLRSRIRRPTNGARNRPETPPWTARQLCLSATATRSSVLASLAYSCRRAYASCVPRYARRT